VAIQSVTGAILAATLQSTRILAIRCWGAQDYVIRGMVLVRHTLLRTPTPSLGGLTHEVGLDSVTAQQVHNLGGAGLLSHQYEDSVWRLLTTVYPSHDWQEWRFTRVPVGFWDDPKGQHKFLSHVAKLHGIKSMSDWYRLTSDDVTSLGGAGLLSRYGNSMYEMLRQAYPSHVWQAWRFDKAPITRQQADVGVDSSNVPPRTLADARAPEAT
jgi:hypothetical protein